MASRRSKLLLMAASCAVLATLACAAPDGPPADLPALRQQIAAEIGDAACSAHTQCRTLPIGHKACGGPEGWLAWSAQRSDGERLTALAGQHAAARRAQVEKSGLASNCMVVADPGAMCVASRCVLRSPPGRGGAAS